MKTIILSTIMLIGLAFTSQAQDVSKNALGLRLGGNDGIGVEVSYQRKLSPKNRLELDLGFRNQQNYYDNDDDLAAVKLAALYQWVWNIDGGFNWYVGVGGGIGSWNHKYNDNNGYSDNGVFAFVAGDIGIEYNFDIPLMLSLDFRPEIGSDNYYNNNYSSDIGLAIRYQF
jgi:hypothetical protein